MAILSKIRERSLFLILIIGMALFAFVASPSKIAGFFKSKKQSYVGSINGEDISREEFINQVKAYKSQNPNAKDDQAGKLIWQNIVSEKLYASQLKEAGIVVGEKDIWESLINEPSIKNNPQFQNEAGMFDEESLKAYIADLQDDKTPEGKQRWASWIAYEKSIKNNLERNAYLNMISSGVEVSIEDAKHFYEESNTILNADYVFMSYASIPDDSVKVSDSDVQNYINQHKNDFQVEASRSLRYVKFDLLASDEDKEAIKAELKGLIADKEGKGFKSTTDYDDFLSEYSDTPYDANIVYKNQLNSKIADSIFSLPLGAIYGPYEDKGFYKLTKVVEIKEVPSVKASHILIAYKGATRAKPEVSRTKEEAKAEAKKVLRKARKSNADFAALAKTYSDGPTGAKGGDLGWFKEGRMVPAFNDWCFAHKKGAVGLVETDFGYHIIKIFDTKQEKGLKLATISKAITPSEKTENKVFVEAETFAANLAKGGDFDELVKAKNYKVNNAQKLKRDDTSVPGLPGNNASIVYWAFNDKTAIHDSKRFDIDKAYVVAQLTEKEAAGLQSIKNAKNKVIPIIKKDKKAAILAKRLQGGSLEEIAQKENLKVLHTGDISLANPGTSAVGREKAVIGALLATQVNNTIYGVKGDRGVYSLKLTKKTPPMKLESYEPYRLQLMQKMKKDGASIYAALKEASEIEDYRK